MARQGMERQGMERPCQERRRLIFMPTVSKPANKMPFSTFGRSLSWSTPILILASTHFVGTVTDNDCALTSDKLSGVSSDTAVLGSEVSFIEKARQHRWFRQSSRGDHDRR
jgi:hypothetical protein